VTDEERLDDLIDDLIRAQDVNQAGFYTASLKEQGVARRAVIDYVAAIRREMAEKVAVLETAGRIVERELKKRLAASAARVIELEGALGEQIRGSRNGEPCYCDPMSSDPHTPECLLARRVMSGNPAAKEGSHVDEEE
jgi:hypothetical protein